MSPKYCTYNGVLDQFQPPNQGRLASGDYGLSLEDNAMSIISTTRSTSPRINPNLRIGRPKPRAATPQELHLLRLAVTHINAASTTTDDTKFTVEVTEAFRILRGICRSKLNK